MMTPQTTLSNTPVRPEIHWPSTPLPESARAVIVGGGVVGASVAYHLAKMGWKDVVLLEQNEIGSGTTWHAAGMVGQLRTSNSLTKINKYSVELYPTLEQETGISDWLASGRQPDRGNQRGEDDSTATHGSHGRGIRRRGDDDWRRRSG